MSKYDNLFKTAYNSDKPTTMSLKPNIFLSKDTNVNNQKDTKYNYKEELFPDLSVNKVGSSVSNTINTSSKNYANITSTVNEVKKANKNPVLSGWIQYSKSNKSKKTIFFDVTYGDKTKIQIEQEHNQKVKDAALNNPVYIHNKIISTLANNWNKYKQQYDEIHGEGAYDLVYYTEPIYPSLDEYLSDDEKEGNPYSSEEEYYSYNNSYNDKY
jgi:hypothetical protein